MPAVNHPLVIEPGATFVIQMHYLNDAETASALQAGWVGRIQFRTAPEGELVHDAIPTLDAQTGSIRLVMTPADTQQCVGATVWGCEIRNNAGTEVVRLVQGRVKISPEVVR